MFHGITSYLLKSAFIAAVFFGMSSPSQAYWYWNWYGYPAYRPVYYYPTYRPVYYTTSYAPACSACNSCAVGCTTCKVGCAPCGACGCAPCECAPCTGNCSVSTASLRPIAEVAHNSRSTRNVPTTVPVPLDLHEVNSVVRVWPTRQRTRAKARDYDVPHVARLDVDPAPSSARQSTSGSEPYVATR